VKKQFVRFELKKKWGRVRLEVFLEHPK